jgi:RNA polymerase sigma factor (sigma-70 family)
VRETTSQQPTQQQLDDFRDGDPVAIAEVIDLALPQLARWAFKRSPTLPQDDILDVVHQVLAEISLHPSRFDPSKASFTTYAFELIKRRLIDVYAKQQRIDAHEESGPRAHEKLVALPYNDAGETDVDVLLTREDFFQQAEQYLTDLEREMCRVMRTSDDPNAIAEVIARFGDSSEVKNARAKIRRRLAVIAAQLGYQAEDVL